MTHIGEYAGQMLIFMLVSTIGVLVFYGLGRWLQPRLRARGYGPHLDAFARWHTSVSRMGLLSALRALRGINEVPVYGSNLQRERLDTMIARTERKQTGRK